MTTTYKTLAEVLAEHATTVPHDIAKLVTFIESGNVYHRFGRNGVLKFTPVIDGVLRDDLALTGTRNGAVAAVLKREGIL